MGKYDMDVKNAVEQTVPAEFRDRFVELWGCMNQATRELLCELAPTIAADYVQLDYFVEAVKIAKRGHSFGSQVPRGLLIAVSQVDARLRHLDHEQVYDGMLKHFTDKNISAKKVKG